METHITKESHIIERYELPEIISPTTSVMKDNRFLALDGLYYIQPSEPEELSELVLPERYREIRKNCIPSLYNNKELTDMRTKYCSENSNGDLRLVCVGFRVLKREWVRELKSHESVEDFESTYSIVLNNPSEAVYSYACLCGFYRVFVWMKPNLTSYSVTKPKNALVHGNFEFLDGICFNG